MIILSIFLRCVSSLPAQPLVQVRTGSPRSSSSQQHNQIESKNTSPALSQAYLSFLISAWSFNTDRTHFLKIIHWWITLFLAYSSSIRSNRLASLQRHHILDKGPVFLVRTC